MSLRGGGKKMDGEVWLFYGIFAILYLLPSGAAVIFYLIRKEQAAAARVCGICSGPPLAFLSLFSVGAIPPFIFPFTMAVGGMVLALKKPKLAGVLMLAGAIGSMAAWLVFAVTAVSDVIPVVTFMPCLLSISFLIPGGILALTSRKGQPASRKMVVVAIAAFFLAPALFSAFLSDLLAFASHLYFELFWN